MSGGQRNWRLEEEGILFHTKRTEFMKELTDSPSPFSFFLLHFGCHLSRVLCFEVSCPPLQVHNKE